MGGKKNEEGIILVWEARGYRQVYNNHIESHGPEAISCLKGHTGSRHKKYQTRCIRPTLNMSPVILLYCTRDHFV